MTNEKIKTLADGYYAGNADWLNNEQEQDTKVGWRQGFAYAFRQFAVSGSVLKVKLHEYGYSCGDGCCYNYGTITTVNDIELPCHNQDAETILRQVLEHLGYNVEIDYSDDVE